MRLLPFFAGEWSGVLALGVGGAGQEFAPAAGPDDHRAFTFVADLIGFLRLLPLFAGEWSGILAFGVAAAGQELSVTSHLDEHGTFAFFAEDVGLLGLFAGDRPGVLAFGVGTAGKEPAGPPRLDLHGLATEIADYPGSLIGDGVRGFVYGLLEGFVKVTDDGHPLPLPAGNLVELPLHLGGKAEVHDVREVIAEEDVDPKAEFSRVYATFLFAYVPAVLDGGEGRGVCTGPAYAVLLQGLDKGGFRVARGRLSEVLLLFKAEEIKGLSSGEVGEGGLFVGGLVIGVFVVEGEETGEDCDGARDSEQVDGRLRDSLIVFGVYMDGGLVD